MKGNNYTRVFLLIIILFTLSFYSCSKWTLPPQLIGEWETEKHKVSVRSEPEKRQYIFTKDTIVVKIKIYADKTAEGYIGDAYFKNARVKKNGGNPKITGVAYIITCESIGKIFPNDPLESKEVELWLGLINENEIMEAELRYTEGWAFYPMAGLVFIKPQ